MTNKYPTLAEVDNASHVQLAKWFRFLPSVENEKQIRIMNRIIDRFKEKGGMTVDISKQIGW